jgi:hypothetical protein
MNHALWKATGARVLAMTFIIAGLAACDRGGDDDRNTRVDQTGLPATASPSATVIGTAPAEPAPKTETAQTAPTTAAARSDVGATAESTKRPIEGDNHSYSTVAPTTPQKADGINHNGDGGENAKGKQ